MSEGMETRREQEELELPWLHPKHIIEPMKKYDAPKFPRREKKSRKDRFCEKINLTGMSIDDRLKLR